MGRPKKSAPTPIEPEEISQDVPDEEPARVIDEDESDDDHEGDGGPGQSKTDLIREAVQAGYEKPARGVEYIRERHGVEIDSKYYSIVKGKLGKGGDRPASERDGTASRPTVLLVQQPDAPGAIPASLFDDLKQLRELKDRYGENFQKIVEAIG